jgi:PD-(D/E)XK endonuclease
MTRERLINRRRQGDLGEFSAMEWLSSVGAEIWIPIGHSPHVDLIAELHGRFIRVQVKTSTVRETTPNGHERWTVRLATLGGNQSWTGLTKKLDPTKVDFVFALVGDGRRWFIPAPALEASTSIALGGSKYAEFEIERGRPIEDLVYGVRRSASRIDQSRGSAGVGEPGSAVNRMPRAEWVRIPPPPFAALPPSPVAPGDPDPSDHGRIGRTRISSGHQITIPVGPFRAAGLSAGDRLHVESDGDGRVVLTRKERVEPFQVASQLVLNGDGPEDDTAER